MLGHFSRVNVCACERSILMLMLVLMHVQVSQHAHISRQVVWDWMHYRQQIPSTNLGLSSMFQRMLQLQLCRSSFADQGLQIQGCQMQLFTFRSHF